MIEAAGRKWPEYAFWLTTGISDPDYGHVAPGSAGFPGKSVRKENSAALFARWLALKATALTAARSYLDSNDMEDLEEWDEFARMISQFQSVAGGEAIDLTKYNAERKLCRDAESLRRAEIILTTDMPKLSYEHTEPLLELVDNLLKKVDGSSKEKLASILKRERTLVNRNNALEEAKDLDGMIAAMRDNNPYKE